MKFGHIDFLTSLTFSCLLLILPTASAQPITTFFPDKFNSETTLAYARQFYGANDNAGKLVGLSADEVWSRLEATGWPDSLRPFRSRFQNGRSYLALYKKLPQAPMDMRSPDRFRRSMTAAEIMDKASIGHMSVGWSCAGANSPRLEGFAAQTGEDSGQSRAMLSSGWGLTGAISTFTDGYLQNAFNIQTYFSNAYVDHIDEGKAPNSYFALVVEVPSRDCEKVREFVKAYALHPAQPYKKFGMHLDPFKFEGGGCGSFAVAALSHAETLEPIFSKFWRDLPVPGKILGLRTKVFLPNDVEPVVWAKTKAQEKPVSRMKLISMNWDRGETALDLHIVDPELAIFSLRVLGTIAEQHQTQPLTKHQIQSLEKMKRIYNFGPAPGDAVDFDNKDLGYQEIDAGFDPSFGAVHSAVTNWWAQREAHSGIRLLSFPFGVGVMVENRN